MSTKESRAFLEMFAAAKEMLKDKTPESIAENAGVSYNEASKTISVPSLGTIYEFHYPDWSCQPEPDHWHYLFLLHYLNLADGSPITGEPITLSQMADGMVRGTKFDQTASRELCKILKGKTESDLIPLFTSLNGTFPESKADLTVCLPMMPHVPITINIWFEDDEFPPSAKLLVDKSIDHYLTIEDAVSLGEYLLRVIAGDADHNTI